MVFLRSLSSSSVIREASSNTGAGVVVWEHAYACAQGGDLEHAHEGKHMR